MIFLSFHIGNELNCVFKITLFLGNQKVKSIIVTEVKLRSPFITYSSQNPWNFLDMEKIMIKEGQVFKSFSIKIDMGYVSSIRTRNSTRENIIYKCYK